MNIYYAMSLGDLELLKKVIEEEGYDIKTELFAGDSLFNNDFTLLHMAAEYGQPHIARYLIEQEGLDIEARSAWGHSPMHIAAAHGHPEVIDVLAQAGADIEGRYHEIFTFGSWFSPLAWLRWYSPVATVTPLCLAAGDGKINAAARLLELGAHINGDERNGDKRNPLTFCC